MASRREKEKSRRTSARSWAESQERSFEPTTIRLPEGIEQWKPDKPGKYEVDFLVYRVGKGNPRADEGMEHFEREYEAHGIETPSGFRMYTCRWHAFHKKCAPCDWRKHNGNADPELLKSLRGKTRHLWLLNDQPGKTKNVKLKIFDSNHYNKGKGFGEQMAEAINSLPEDAEPFALEGGYTATLVVKEDTMGGGKKYFYVARIDLRPRKHDYPESLLDDAPCLDSCIVDPGYDDIMALLDGEVPDKSNDEDDRDDEPKGKKRPEREDTEEDDEDMDSDDEPASKAKKKSKPDPDEDEDTEEEEPAPKSKGRSGGGKSRSASDEDEDEDLDSDEPSDDSDEDEEPRRKPASKTSGKKRRDRLEGDLDSEDDFDDDDSDDEEPPRRKAGSKR